MVETFSFAVSDRMTQNLGHRVMHEQADTCMTLKMQSKALYMYVLLHVAFTLNTFIIFGPSLFIDYPVEGCNITVILFGFMLPNLIGSLKRLK